MEKLDFGKGAVPLYIQIKKIIKDKILLYMRESYACSV